MKKHFKKGLIHSITLLSLLSSVSTTFAATTTSNFTVTATVAASCTVSATSLAFGNYTLAVNDASSNITVTCTNGTTYEVLLNAGTGTGATTSNRKMTGPSSATLLYGLFTDSGRTTNWLAAAGGGVSGTGSGAAQTIPVYGRIPANQTAPIGSYSDTIVVTVSYP